MPALLQLPGVKSVAVNLLLNSAVVSLDASQATGPRDVIGAIDDAGKKELHASVLVRCDKLGFHA